MEFRSRNNQPQPAARPAQAAPAARPSFEGSDMESPTTNSTTRSGTMSSRSPKNKMMMCGLVILALIILFLAFSYIQRSFFSNEAAIDTSKYQAIFLTNGQVYFGHLSNVDSDYAKLTNIYYLQVQQQVQPSSNSSNSNSSSQQPQVSLTKLGNELHGPQDMMYIAHPQILFWENLKDNGKVALAIKQSLNQK